MIQTPHNSASEAVLSDVPNERIAELDRSPRNDEWALQTVEALLELVWRGKATDLHMRLDGNGVRLAWRREGSMEPLGELGPARAEELVGRLRVLARLPSFNRNEPADGRIEWTPPGSEESVSLRLSLMPSVDGMGAVVRFPQRQGPPPRLDELGMTADVENALTELALEAEGMLAVTGPAGSGKTTTLYALLHLLNERRGGELSFVTIEDPVERDAPFALQTQVAPAQNLTFERALRAALRHDPDVLLLGEVRDAETAIAAVQAAVTGHLVMTTLHAGRASRVFTRLLAMGVEPYLVASAMTGSLAQRLVRRGSPPRRTGVFELVCVTEELRETILRRASFSEIAEACARAQYGDLERDGAKQ